jgi:comEA protein
MRAISIVLAVGLFAGLFMPESPLAPSHAYAATRFKVKVEIKLPTRSTAYFDANGGKLSGSPAKRVTKGKLFGKLPTAKRSGYKFEGWYSGRVRGKQIEAGSTVTIKTDKTYYAHWKEVQKEKKPASSKEKGTGKKQSGYSAKVNVNTANYDELMKIKGVGPAIAQAIIEHRGNKGPFLYPEDLLKIEGIGKKKLEKMKKQLSF